MSGRRPLAALLLALLLLPAPARAAVAPPAVGARGAALMEAETGRLLFAQASDARLPMASTTKIMTALIALERCSVDEMVTVPREAYGVEGSSMYLNAGEELLLSDLLYGLMLVSGNDAAVAIACHVAGSVEAFAALMNERARELGCTDTHFVTPNGLPDDDHYTTAADLCRIACAAMQNEAFAALVGTTYHETSSGDKTRTLKNKNKVLWQYEGGCGVKTGYTDAAGRCLVFAAEREGTRLVGVVLNCPDMWNAAYALLDYGFAAYQTRLIVDAGACVGYAAVDGGVKNGLAIFTKQAILYPLQRDGSDEVAFRIDCADTLQAPVAAGQAAGTLTLLVNGREAASVPLVTEESVTAANVGFYLQRILHAWPA